MNQSLFTRGFTLKRQLVTPTLQVTRLSKAVHTLQDGRKGL